MEEASSGRVYDPKIARFVQADPIVQDPRTTRSLNRYSYVWNNPLNATDPSGYRAEGFGTCSACNLIFGGEPDDSPAGLRDYQRAMMEANHAISSGRYDVSLDGISINSYSGMDGAQSQFMERLSNAMQGWNDIYLDRLADLKEQQKIQANRSGSGQSAIDQLKGLPDDPSEVFKQGYELAKKQDELQLDKSRVIFSERHAFCPQICTSRTIQFRDTVSEAISFLRNNPNYGILHGTYSGGWITVYPIATVSSRVNYPYGTGGYRNYRLNGGSPYMTVYGAESVLTVIAHEVGHREGVEHGPDMHRFEYDAIRRSRQ